MGRSNKASFTPQVSLKDSDVVILSFYALSWLQNSMSSTFYNPGERKKLIHNNVAEQGTGPNLQHSVQVSFQEETECHPVVKSVTAAIDNGRSF